MFQFMAKSVIKAWCILLQWPAIHSGVLSHLMDLLCKDPPGAAGLETKIRNAPRATHDGPVQGVSRWRDAHLPAQHPEHRRDTPGTARRQYSFSDPPQARRRSGDGGQGPWGGRAARARPLPWPRLRRVCPQCPAPTGGSPRNGEVDARLFATGLARISPDWRAGSAGAPPYNIHPFKAEQSDSLQSW